MKDVPRVIFNAYILFSLFWKDALIAFTSLKHGHYSFYITYFSNIYFRVILHRITLIEIIFNKWNSFESDIGMINTYIPGLPKTHKK